MLAEALVAAERLRRGGAAPAPPGPRGSHRSRGLVQPRQRLRGAGAAAPPPSSASEHPGVLRSTWPSPPRSWRSGARPSRPSTSIARPSRSGPAIRGAARRGGRASIGARATRTGPRWRRQKETRPKPDCARERAGVRLRRTADITRWRRRRRAKAAGGALLAGAGLRRAGRAGLRPAGRASAVRAFPRADGRGAAQRAPVPGGDRALAAGHRPGARGSAAAHGARGHAAPEPGPGRRAGGPGRAARARRPTRPTSTTSWATSSWPGTSPRAPSRSSRRRCGSSPAAPHAHGALGRAYALAGRAADAIPHLKQALPADVDGSLRYQLARAYQAAGQADEARGRPPGLRGLPQGGRSGSGGRATRPRSRRPDEVGRPGRGVDPPPGRRPGSGPRLRAREHPHRAQAPDRDHARRRRRLRLRRRRPPRRLLHQRRRHPEPGEGRAAVLATGCSGTWAACGSPTSPRRRGCAAPGTAWPRPSPTTTTTATPTSSWAACTARSSTATRTAGSRT